MTAPKSPDPAPTGRYSKLELARHERGLVITPTAGVLAVQAEIDALRKEINAAVKDNPAKVYVLDLGKVGFVSSAFLGNLVDMAKKFRAAGAPFRLCRVQPEIAKVLKASKLDSLLDIRVDVPDALHL
jgi:anti-anti-sigma factor